MKHDNEKLNLEKAAIEYFIKAYPRKLELTTHGDKPDFTLINSEDKSSIGVEITHLWHDEEEAQILLNRSNKTTHSVMKSDALIKELNKLVANKIEKSNQYATHDKQFLVIRVVSPIFDISTFVMHETDIIIPKNKYDEIWLLLNDNNKSERWTELMFLKG